MTGVLDQLLGLHGTAVYVIVSLLVFAEDAVFVGFVLPGEAAAVLGGVAASRGNVSLTVMCAVVVAAAILGDSVGYGIGDHYGVRLLELRPLHRRGTHIDAARSMLARRGGPAVFAGRFVAFLRATMPFLAGISHMPYLRFLAYNAAGGLVWGVGNVLLGYLAGSSYTAVENTFGTVTAVIAALVLILGVTAWTVRRHRRQRRSTREPDPTDS
jgi:membrane-associated protein